MPDRQQPSIADLVMKTVTDAKRLVTAHLALAQAEMKASRNAIVGAAIFAIAVMLMSALAVLFLLFTLAFGLAQLGLQTWAAFGIVSLLLLVITGTCGAIAVSQARKIKGPELALRELAKTQEAFGVSDPSL